MAIPPTPRGALVDTKTGFPLVEWVKWFAALLRAFPITNADVSATAAIAFSKLAALTSGNILVGSAGNVATSVAMSGAGTLSNAGVLALTVVTASGVYTPTLFNVANVAASTAYQCQYARVGSVVTVSGKVDVDPTLAATSTQVGISLPVASNIGALEDCCGTAFASGIAAQGAAILGDMTNDRAQMQWISSDITNQSMYFHFQYRII